MIDLHGIKTACSELHKRTGVYIELYDNSHNMVFSTSSRRSADPTDKDITITPRTNKSYSIRIIPGKSPINDSHAQLISLYLEPFFTTKDPANILKDTLLGNLTAEACVQQLKALRIDPEFAHRLYIIKCLPKHLTETLDITSEMIESGSRDFLFSFNDDTLVLIKECEDEMSEDDAWEMANALCQSVNFEIPENTLTVAVSRLFYSLESIENAYLSAVGVMRIGNICNTGKSVHIAEKLRLEEFLDTLPSDALLKFIDNYSADTFSDAWDDRMAETVQALFDNNLNLSVTARELYTHRNTLVYRLDKIKKLSGFDLRAFDDAVMLKILMTADKLMKNKKNNRKDNA